jgi:hypothetical protein
MNARRVRTVSEIVRLDNEHRLSYGFTITYDDGEIKNIIRNSSIDNDKLILAELQTERKKFIIKIEGEKVL